MSCLQLSPAEEIVYLRQAHDVLGEIAFTLQKERDRSRSGFGSGDSGRNSEGSNDSSPSHASVFRSGTASPSLTDYSGHSPERKRSRHEEDSEYQEENFNLELDILKEELEIARKEIGILEGEKKLLTEENLNLQREGTMQKEELEILKNGQQQENPNSELEPELGSLKEQVEMGKKEIRILTGEKKVLADENLNLRKEATIRKEELETARKETRCLKKEKRELAGELDGVKKERDGLLGNVRAKAKQLATLTDEKHTSDGLVEEFKVKFDRLKEQVDELFAEKNASDEKWANAKSEDERLLSDRIEKLAEIIDARDRQIEEITREQRLCELSVMEREKEKEELNAKLVKLEADKAEAEQRCQTLIDGKSEDGSGLKQNVEVLEKEKQAAEKNVKEKRLRIAQLESEAEELKRQLKGMEDKMTMIFDGEISAETKNSAYVALLRSKVTELQNALTEKKEPMVKSREEWAKLQVKLDKELDDNKKLYSHCQELYAKVKRQEVEIKCLKDKAKEVNTMEEKIVAIKSDYEKKLDICTKAVKDTSTQLQDKKRALEILENELNMKKAQLAKSQKEVQMLQKLDSRTELIEENRKQHDKIRVLEMEKAELERNLLSARNEVQNEKLKLQLQKQVYDDNAAEADKKISDALDKAENAEAEVKRVKLVVQEFGRRETRKSLTVMRKEVSKNLKPEVKNSLKLMNDFLKVELARIHHLAANLVTVPETVTGELNSLRKEQAVTESEMEKYRKKAEKYKALHLKNECWATLARDYEKKLNEKIEEVENSKALFWQLERVYNDTDAERVRLRQDYLILQRRLVEKSEAQSLDQPDTTNSFAHGDQEETGSVQSGPSRDDLTTADTKDSQQMLGRNNQAAQQTPAIANQITQVKQEPVECFETNPPSLSGDSSSGEPSISYTKEEVDKLLKECENKIVNKYQEEMELMQDQQTMTARDTVLLKQTNLELKNTVRKLLPLAKKYAAKKNCLSKKRKLAASTADGLATVSHGTDGAPGTSGTCT